MDMKIDRSLLEAYSRGEISRRDISNQMDAEVRFGDCSPPYKLPLPRFPCDRSSPGVQLIKRLAERAVRSDRTELHAVHSAHT